MLQPDGAQEAALALIPLVLLPALEKVDNFFRTSADPQ